MPIRVTSRNQATAQLYRVIRVGSYPYMRNLGSGLPITLDLERRSDEKCT